MQFNNRSYHFAHYISHNMHSNSNAYVHVQNLTILELPECWTGYYITLPVSEFPLGIFFLEVLVKAHLKLQLLVLTFVILGGVILQLGTRCSLFLLYGRHARLLPNGKKKTSLQLFLHTKVLY